MANFILEQMALCYAVYKKCLMKTFLKSLCIWQILHVIHFICDKSMQTLREQKESLHSATLADRSVRRCMKSNHTLYRFQKLCF